MKILQLTKILYGNRCFFAKNVTFVPMEIQPIAYFESPLKTKFGIPRQSGLVDALKGRIIFCENYRLEDAVRGLESFSHLWLIWGFSANGDEHRQASLTVRPPRLGGNTRMGVFATRSPFRPNPLGLSCVRMEKIDYDSDLGPVIYVRGADLMDGTPIYDIKPYVVYADARPEAKSGFVDQTRWSLLKVSVPESLSSRLPADQLEALKATLAQDPRPAYHDDPQRVYGMFFLDIDVRFKVADGVLTVVDFVKK